MYANVSSTLSVDAAKTRALLEPAGTATTR